MPREVSPPPRLRLRTPRRAATCRRPPAAPYNILFIPTDQERLFRPGELPKDYRLPAHERLAKKGVDLVNPHDIMVFDTDRPGEKDHGDLDGAHRHRRRAAH